MSSITEEYRELQEKFHKDCPEYGTSGQKYIDIVLGFAEKLKTRDILDFGCGKQTLQKGIPWPIKQYDPCIPEFSAAPEPAALVVCTDVLEHIEEECLADVLLHLWDCTKTLLFVQIATGPAKKFLPDGRNAHLIQQDANWWLNRMLPIFAIQSCQVEPGGVLALFTPIQIKEEESDTKN